MSGDGTQAMSTACSVSCERPRLRDPENRHCTLSGAGDRNVNRSLSTRKERSPAPRAMVNGGGR
jgi:hypothetical protein